MVDLVAVVARACLANDPTVLRQRCRYASVPSPSSSRVEPSISETPWSPSLRLNNRRQPPAPILVPPLRDSQSTWLQRRSRGGFVQSQRPCVLAGAAASPAQDFNTCAVSHCTFTSSSGSGGSRGVSIDDRLVIESRRRRSAHTSTVRLRSPDGRALEPVTVRIAARDAGCAWGRSARLRLVMFSSG